MLFWAITHPRRLWLIAIPAKSEETKPYVVCLRNGTPTDPLISDDLTYVAVTIETGLVLARITPEEDVHIPCGALIGLFRLSEAARKALQERRHRRWDPRFAKETTEILRIINDIADERGGTIFVNHEVANANGYRRGVIRFWRYWVNACKALTAA